MNDFHMVDMTEKELPNDCTCLWATVGLMETFLYNVIRGKAIFNITIIVTIVHKTARMQGAVIMSELKELLCMLFGTM